VSQSPLFVAFLVAGAGHVYAVLLLCERIKLVGRAGMGRFADVKFFTFNTRSDWRALNFLFMGRHHDRVADTHRLLAAVLFVCACAALVGSLLLGHLI